MADNTVEPSTRFRGVPRFEDPMGMTAIVSSTAGLSHRVWYVIHGVVGVVLGDPFAMRDFDMFLWLLSFSWTMKATNNPHEKLCVWTLELGIWTQNPHAHIRHSPHYMCRDFLRLLRNRVKGQLPLQKIMEPSPFANPNPSVPEPKPSQMHLPHSDGSRNPGWHLPQRDQSRHGAASEVATVSCHELVFSADATSSSTCSVCYSFLHAKPFLAQIINTHGHSN